VTKELNERMNVGREIKRGREGREKRKREKERRRKGRSEKTI
jgi:hypothetical protein